MKTLMVLFSFFVLVPSYALGPSRPCSQEQQQEEQGKGKGKGGGGQQQCQEQQQEQQDQGKEGICAPLYAACRDAGYAAMNEERCVSGILSGKESEIKVYLGHKIACENFRNSLK